jgi:3-deoxy-D-manno-octulosonic-acid transferase
VFFIYEGAQKIIFYFLIFLSYFLKNKKYQEFCKLRSPHHFFMKIKTAHQVYLSLSKKNIEIYWFHVSSAGEMEQAIPVANTLHHKKGAFFFVTYYSPSARPFLKDFPGILEHSGLPLDIRKYYKMLFKVLPIQKIFFVRYDIWPALFHVCKGMNIEINLISATLVKTKQGFSSLLSTLWNKRFYKYFSHIFAVSEEDREYFLKFLSQENIHLAGDPKWARAFDRVYGKFSKNPPQEFAFFLNYCSAQKKVFNKKTLVFGSPHVVEHKIALKCIELKKHLFLIYVPHSVDLNNCKKLLKAFSDAGWKVTLYSNLIKKIKKYGNDFYKYKEENILNDPFFFYEVIIIDKMGLLANIYAVGEIAIVGGGFNGKIHNLLEPAACGVPILIGPYFSRADEAKKLAQVGALVSFQKSNDLFQFLVQWVRFTNEGNDSSHPISHLGYSKTKTLELFKSIPDTSEIVLRILSKSRQ